MNLSKQFLSLLAVGSVLQAGVAPAQDSAGKTENVQAQWQPRELNFQLVVTLPTHADHPMGSGDCEFLEQIRDQLLPALKLQIVKDEVRCFPGEVVLGNPTIQVAALVPVAQVEKK